jgi:hypothetical protein
MTQEYLNELEKRAFEAETKKRDAAKLYRDIQKAEARGRSRAVPTSEKIKAAATVTARGVKTIGKTAAKGAGRMLKKAGTAAATQVQKAATAPPKKSTRNNMDWFANNFLMTPPQAPGRKSKSKSNDMFPDFWGNPAAIDMLDKPAKKKKAKKKTTTKKKK